MVSRCRFNTLLAATAGSAATGPLHANAAGPLDPGVAVEASRRRLRQPGRPAPPGPRRRRFPGAGAAAGGPARAGAGGVAASVGPLLLHRQQRPAHVDGPRAPSLPDVVPGLARRVRVVGLQLPELPNETMGAPAELARRNVPNPDRGRRRWRGQFAVRDAVYANRRRIRRPPGRPSLRLPAERLERPHARPYENRPVASGASARARQHPEPPSRPGLRLESRLGHAAPVGHRYAAHPPQPARGPFDALGLALTRFRRLVSPSEALLTRRPLDPAWIPSPNAASSAPSFHATGETVSPKACYRFMGRRASACVAPVRTLRQPWRRPFVASNHKARNLAGHLSREPQNATHLPMHAARKLRGCATIPQPNRRASWPSADRPSGAPSRREAPAPPSKRACSRLKVATTGTSVRTVSCRASCTGLRCA